MKKILFALMACLLCLGLVGGAFAYFSDTETSYGNTFTAGTLDLKVDADPTSGGTNWVDDPDVPTINDLIGAAVDNLKPGDSADVLIGIKNAGTIDGIAGILLDVYDNDDNGLTEPESDVDSTGGPGEGELPFSIKVAIDYNGTYLSGYEIADAVSLASLDSVPIVLGGLAAGTEACISLHLWIPTTVGNEIQSDSCKVDVEFSLDQVH